MGEWTPEQKLVIERIRVVYAEWVDRGEELFNTALQGAFLCGAVGAGKTAIARAMFPQAVWFNAPDVGKEATSAMHQGHSGRTANDMIRDAAGARVVVIDEIGRERESDHYGRDTIWSILNTALHRRRFIVVISNKTPADVVKSYGGDEGLGSRLAALELIEFPATMPDFRRLRAAMAGKGKA